jgi:hypothetical protein
VEEPIPMRLIQDLNDPIYIPYLSQLALNCGTEGQVVFFSVSTPGWFGLLFGSILQNHRILAVLRPIGTFGMTYPMGPIFGPDIGPMLNSQNPKPPYCSSKSLINLSGMCNGGSSFLF